MHPTIKSWLSKSREELDEIYRNAEAGEIPDGDTQGTAILAGSPFSKIAAAFARIFAWHGKVFHLFCPNRQSGILVNKISPFSLTFIIAEVYRDKSWLDGKDTIVIDYSKTSFFARAIRDEIREVEAGVYLGKVWWGKKRILDFALTRDMHSQP
ncbi:hypothetical protein SAMN04489760_104165 [Syntrophus gentianae]|uniref:Uncharacterized protein n=1 Tax=Syntrophus gentianae TaxID=43775 RepID=A0A1H7VS80_9BACT|nr:hypothetical protein [Syntrophus gentianae]SEM12113.1 hypothetical protein SAMN04489760_104165 [Syntrophus gentianae]